MYATAQDVEHKFPRPENCGIEIARILAGRTEEYRTQQLLAEELGNGRVAVVEDLVEGTADEELSC